VWEYQFPTDPTPHELVQPLPKACTDTCMQIGHTAGEQGRAVHTGLEWIYTSYRDSGRWRFPDDRICWILVARAGKPSLSPTAV